MRSLEGSYRRRLTRLALCVASGAAALASMPRIALAREPTASETAPTQLPGEKAADGESDSRVLSLADVERAALDRQPQVLAARAAVDVAQGQADQARSPLLPQVTATAQYLRETGNYAPRPGAPFRGAAVGGSLFSPSFDFWSLGVGATQLVYDFGQTPGKYRAAATSADAQHQAEETTRVGVVYAVRRAFFNARAMKELVNVARLTLEDQKRHLLQVQGFVSAGTQPEIALAQERAAVANAQVQLIGAQNSYETAKAQLNQAAGLAQGTDYEVADQTLGPVDGEDQPLATLVSRALANRPEMKTLGLQRQAQESTIRSVRGGYGPTLSATAGASEVGESLTQLVPNWNAGLVLSWPIYQGGLTQGQLRSAEGALTGIDAQRSLEQLQVRLDVDTARLAVRAAKATIGAAADAESSAKEQLTLAEQRYRTGVGSIIELNDAQVAFTSAAAQVVQARYGLASARAQLLAALGRS